MINLSNDNINKPLGELRKHKLLGFDWKKANKIYVIDVDMENNLVKTC